MLYKENKQVLKNSEIEKPQITSVNLRLKLNAILPSVQDYLPISQEATTQCQHTLHPPSYLRNTMQRKGTELEGVQDTQ